MRFKETPARRFLWLPVCLGVGIWTYFALSFEPEPWHIYALTSLALTLLIANYFSYKSYFINGVAFFCIGIVLSFYRVHTLNTYMSTEFFKDITLSGTVTSVENQEEALRITLQDVHFLENPQEKDNPRSRIHKIRFKISASKVNTPQKRDLLPGAKIILQGKLIPFQGPVFQNSLDMRRQGYLDGISCQGTIKKIIKIEPLQHTSASLILQKYRHTLTQKIMEKLPSDTSGIAAALITGDRSYIHKNVRQEFVDAGIAHILAISGLHLSIIAGFAFFLIRGSLALIPVIVERYPIKKIAAMSVIFLTFAYLLISGAGYPVQRAFIMTTFAMIAIMMDRQAISMRLLAFAALFILLLKPESLLSASFQLSFSAVLALIAFYESGWRIFYEWGRYGGWIRKFLAYVSAIILTTMIATIATAPFTIFFFNRFTLQAIIGNVLAIPLTGFCVMPTAFLATVSLLWGGSPWIFKIFDLSLYFLGQIASFTASLPGAAILIPTPPLWALGLVVMGGLWLCLWQTRQRYIGLPFIVIGFLCFSIDTTPDVLISPHVIAYKNKNTLYVSSSKGRFEQGLWQRYLGLKDIQKWEGPVIKIGSTLLIDNPRAIAKESIDHLCDNKNFHFYLTTGYLPRHKASALRARGALIIDRENLKKTIYGFWLKSHKALPMDPNHKRPWQ